MARHAPPVRIQCAAATVSGTDALSASASADGFVLSRNCWGGMPTGDIRRAYDPQDPLHLWVRNAHFVGFQPQQMWHPAGRAGWIANWTDIHNTNPLALCVVHQAPLHNTPGFRVKKSEKYYGLVNWAQSTANIDRKDVALSFDALDELSFSTNSQTSTTNKRKQAGWTPLVTNEAVRERLSDIVVDAIAGTNLTGENFGGGDVSHFMGFMHDGSDVVFPKSGAALRSIRSTGGTGFINSIVSSNSQQPIIVRLSEDLELDTTGTALAEDSSFEECVEVDAIWFFPPGDAGFIGYHILAYRSDTSSRCQIYLKSLSEIAHETQLLTPAAGWRYVCNDQRSGSINADWDRDGLNEDAYSLGQANWGAALLQYRDLVDQKMLLHTGHNTVFGWSQASSHLQKRNRGLPNPHGQAKGADFLQQEEHENDFVFPPTELHEAHGYDASKTQMERGMRASHFLLTSIRDNPGGWAQNKPRGPMLEFTIWGDDYSDVNALDASWLRFWLAVTKMTRPEAIINHPTIQEITCPMTSQLRERRPAFPVALEEYWLDFNTNWSGCAPIGQYDPGGGPSGDSNQPVGVWTFATADAGERIYIRRFGNWLCAMNIAEPAGLGLWVPTHLPGGWTARDPEDIITQADIDATGLLSGGETLSHFNPATYVNQRATDRLIAASPSIWTGFKYGPRQPHPAGSGNDSAAAYDNDDALWIARDDTKNDGSDVSFPYSLGPLEAVFWEISS